MRSLRTGSPWREGATTTRRAALRGDRACDVAVVGAGVTGLVTALLCARRGLDVCVLDAVRIAAGKTGASPAHLTTLLDRGWRALVAEQGIDRARAAARSHREAADRT